jgi:hypothetical protein
MNGGLDMHCDHRFAMKTLIPIGMFSLTLVAFGETEQQPKPVFRDAATHEELVLALRKAEQNDPMKVLPQSQGGDPSKVNQPLNLLEQSDIICFGDKATLVPKRAILSAPAKHKDRLALQPGVKIIGWSDFYVLNRGWITTVEVTRAQAEGNAALPEETQERIGKSTNLVVATYMGGPISVLPLKEQPAAEPKKNTP